MRSPPEGRHRRNSVLYLVLISLKNFLVSHAARPAVEALSLLKRSRTNLLSEGAICISQYVRILNIGYTVLLEIRCGFIILGFAMEIPAMQYGPAQGTEVQVRNL